MSRDTNQICHTCGVYESGSGLNATLIDRYATVEEFDDDLMRNHGMTPEELDEKHPVHENNRIRRFMVRHAGHQIEHWSWDWVYDEDDPLLGLTLEEV